MHHLACRYIGLIDVNGVYLADSNSSSNELSSSWVDYGGADNGNTTDLDPAPRVITPPRIRSPLLHTPQSSPAYVLILTQHGLSSPFQRAPILKVCQKPALDDDKTILIKC